MEVAEAIYEGEEATSKNKTPKADINYSGGGNQKGGESSSPTRSMKIRAGKRKSNHAKRPKSDKSDASL